MTWNFHQYYTHPTDGLIGQLILSEQDKDKLKALRRKVRLRTRDIFEEARKIAAEVKNQGLEVESVKSKLSDTKLKYLSDEQQQEVARLICDMDEDARKEFLELVPRFWTQGSFQYNTLNRPFQLGQEMDIDDGTYLPMSIFESKPKIGHTLLLLLVDSSLKSLEAENSGWHFEAKKTCGRIKIPYEKTHIDVPMYAIPKEEFLKKEIALSKGFESFELRKDAADSAINESLSAYEVNSENVNLALREGMPKWLNSDPKVVEDWFNDSCDRIGSQLRKVCRFMKAWRDAQWKVEGPSSISLMAATVSILDKFPYDKNDIGATMKIVAQHLPSVYRNGIISPDDSDEKPLFPPHHEHREKENAIMEKIIKLHEILVEAEDASSKPDALRIINKAFGNRVTNSSLIVATLAAPAFIKSPSEASKPTKISTTMVSG